jgi:hypothetical protein
MAKKMASMEEKYKKEIAVLKVLVFLKGNLHKILFSISGQKCGNWQGNGH